MKRNHLYSKLYLFSFLVLILFYGCQLDDSPIATDYDYLHTITDLNIQDNKLNIGIKNEKDKLIANIELNLLLRNENKANLRFNILNKLHYNNPESSWDFMDKKFFTNGSNYHNELPTFSKNLNNNELHCIFPKYYLYDLNTKSTIPLKINNYFNSLNKNSKMYTSIFHDVTKYFYRRYALNEENLDKYPQSFVSYNIQTGQVDTLIYSNSVVLNDEHIRYSLTLNDSIYVCRNNTFLNVESKLITKFDEIKDDYIIETFQETKDNVILSTYKSKMLLFNSIKDYKVIDCATFLKSDEPKYNNFEITEIYFKNNNIYFIVCFDWISKDTPFKYKLYKLDVNSNIYTIIFDFNWKDELKYDFNLLNRYTFFNNNKFTDEWSLAVDSQENIYVGCNGLFIYNKNGSLINFYNSFDLARMCGN